MAITFMNPRMLRVKGTYSRKSVKACKHALLCNIATPVVVDMGGIVVSGHAFVIAARELNVEVATEEREDIM